MKKVIIICTKLSKVLYKSVAFKLRNTKSYVTKIHSEPEQEQFCHLSNLSYNFDDLPTLGKEA